MRKALICLLAISLYGCTNTTSTVVESPQPTIQPIIVDVDQPVESTFYTDDKTITITSSHLIDDPSQLLQWINDQIQLVDLWINDDVWFDQLNAIEVDTPTGLDQRMLTLLELGQLINQTIPSLSPLVLSNTYFNAYDYIHIDKDASTLTLDTPLDFMESEELYDALLANQLILSQPWFDFDHILLEATNSLLVINRNSTYVPIPINDPDGKACLTLNLTKSNWIKTIALDDDRTIVLISNDPLTIGIIEPYLDELSYDQLDLILDAFHQAGHPIQAIWFDTQDNYDMTKLKDGDYAITWSDGLDQQLMPIGSIHE